MPVHYIIFGVIIAILIVGAVLTTNFIMKNIQRLHTKFNTSLGILNAELTAMKKKFHMPTLMKGMGFNRKVLCIDKEEVLLHSPDYIGGPTREVDFAAIDKSKYHLIDRDVVDGKTYLTVGQQFLQLIGYTVIRYNGSILTYSRGKGAEERLHKKRSIGFGGHIDLEDIIDAMQQDNPTFLDVLASGIVREIEEELGLAGKFPILWKHKIRESLGTKVIYDTSDEVGSVHLALVNIIDLDDTVTVTPDLSEISDPVWVKEEDLIFEVDNYENWSRIIIQEYT